MAKNHRTDKRARITGKASKTIPRHVRLHHYLLRSAAWQDLSCYARCALVELYAVYNGENNGEIAMSERTLAVKLRCAVPTARKALGELVDHGFVRVQQRGSFHRKIPHATLWRLTEHPVGNSIPTKEFMRWETPQEKAEIFSRINDVSTAYKPDYYANNLEGKKNALAG